MHDRHLFTSRLHTPDGDVARQPPVFPLPVLDRQAPVVLVFDPEDHGIEIAYERNAQDGPRVRSATRESTLYTIPTLTPVFAVADGTIVYASKHTDGYALLVTHRDGWSSYYKRLEHMFATPSELRPREAPVRRGDVLGYAGSAGALRALRFELWRSVEGEEYEPIDPIRYLDRWRLCRWDSSRTEAARSSHVT